MTLQKIKEYAKGLHLLYVEDDVKARTTTLEMLKNLFGHITVATNGEEGLEKFQKEKFHIVITDINMPEMNGIEMIGKIRQKDSKIPIFILSAHNDTSYILDAIELGVDGFILKPLKYKQFLDALKKALEKIHLEMIAQNYRKDLEKEIEKQTKEIKHKLYFDDLTGLLNRYSFFEDLKEIAVPIIFMIDINGFKTINEIYGTETGSFVLKEFANFLKKFAAEENYKIYRVSADEFVVLDDCSHIDFEKYELLLKKFFKEFEDFRVVTDNDTISFEVTIGISTSQYNPYECATIALEYAKKHKKPYTMYSNAIDSRSLKQDAIVWKNKIKQAIYNNDVVTVYQCIVNQNQKVVKHEALMRLRDEDGGLVTPYHFLDISIKTGLYHQLSSYVIFESLRKIEKSRETISLNFTYNDIKNTLFIEEIENYIKQSSDIGSLIVMEITESQSMENFDEIRLFIQRFRKYGVKFAIDDFGSGFSNFENILEIAPDYIKLDGSLVKNVDKDMKSRILVEAIVSFSHKLNIKVIAEFVHSQKVFEILKSFDIDEYQGFYFCEPNEKLIKEKSNG
ncbi:EAL domain-containing protein [Sulfurimonas sp. NWX79]|uniref:EAL domain-containing response regulator n=1 Tax=Sulfurimonas sp. NWX79 TaxID=2925412 RepID=UPI003204F14E